MAARLILYLRRVLDLLCFLFFAAPIAVGLAAYWRLRRAQWRATCQFATPPVMISITADTIEQTRKTNDRDYVEAFYSRPLFARALVLHVGQAATSVARLGRRVIGLDVAVPSIGFWRRLLPLCGRLVGELSAVRVCMEVMRREGSDYLEVMSPGPMIFQAMLIKTLTGCRLVTQVRGNVDLLTDAMGGRYYYCRLPSGWAPLRFVSAAVHHAISDGFHRRCDLVIGFNVNNMQSAISNGASPERTRLSRIEVDESMIAAAPMRRDEIEGFPAMGKVVAIWARLDVGKRLAESIEGFLLFARRHEGVTLVVIGDGPLRGELEAIAAQERMSERVVFMGYRNRACIAAAASYMDAVIVPYGGSSLVEAALLGLPIVAFDIEWHSELIRPGETGYLADYPDPGQMAEQLSAALADDGEAQRMAVQCNALARRMFDRESATAAMARHMAKLIGSKVDS